MNRRTTGEAGTVWADFWKGQDTSQDRLRTRIALEQATCRWKRMKAYLDTHRPHSGTLRTLELGAGAGDYSLLMALEGCDVTLVDSEPRARPVAESQFRCSQQQFRYVLASFDELSERVKEKFDIVFSIGVAEHFVGRKQQELLQLHAHFLNDCGVMFVSVPNRFCVPYRLWKWRLERSGCWQYGVEIPVSRSELFRWGRALGLADITVMGSSFIRSWDEYLLSPVTARLHKYLGVNFERPSWLDQYGGYALVLAGAKGRRA